MLMVILSTRKSILQYQLSASIQSIQRISWTALTRQQLDSIECSATGSFPNHAETARPVHARIGLCAEELAESLDDILWQPSALEI
jgi:hypothetical protein